MGNVRGKISRAVGIMLLLVAVMLAVISVPIWQAYKYHADEIGCAASLKTARDSLAIEVVSEGEALMDNTSRQTLARTMPGRDGLCPAGGTVYLLPLENGSYDLVCGLHDSDVKERTRLNASYAFGELEASIYKTHLRGQEISETINVELNGEALECVRVSEAPKIRRGTGTTEGYDGVVAFFALEGQDGWQDTGADEGALCYFLYADEDYCAVWHVQDGWMGDSYS